MHDGIENVAGWRARGECLSSIRMMIKSHIPFPPPKSAIHLQSLWTQCRHQIKSLDAQQLDDGIGDTLVSDDAAGSGDGLVQSWLRQRSPDFEGRE